MVTLKRVLACKFSLVLLVFLLFTLLAIPASSLASDLEVRYLILAREGLGTTWKGTLRLEVLNLTDGDLRNVDLRLAHPGLDSIERGLVQFGSIPAGKMRDANVGFLSEMAEGALLLWRVDYDDPAGAHHQVVIHAIQEGQ